MMVILIMADTVMQLNTYYIPNTDLSQFAFNAGHDNHKKNLIIPIFTNKVRPKV